MLYQVSLTVPANTPSDKPVETRIIIKHPVITKLGVLFPRGCMGMVHASVYYGDMQLWPAKEGEWIKGEGTTVWDEPFLPLPEERTKLRLLGCSPGTAYDHTITFYIIALPRVIALWMIAVSRLTRLFEIFLAKLMRPPIPVR